jgi:uncharacterized caspase-like protein
MPRLFLALILTLLFTPLAQAAHQTAMAGDAAQRYALVIGNDQYAAFQPPLEKAGNDARAMAKVLEKAGFKATLLLNGNEKKMNAAVNEFVDNIAGGGIGVLFFAGHGVQINNQNYLLPVDMEPPKRERDVEDQAVSLQVVQEKIAQAHAKFTLVVVDACRNNPLPKRADRAIGGTRGLTQPSAPNGQMVIYSAGANETALDKLHDKDRNPNGLFTREFIGVLGTPGLSVGDALKRVRSSVIAKAKGVNHDQHPAVYDQTDGDFYLVPVPAAPEAATQMRDERGLKPINTTPVAVVPAQDPVEAAYWAEVSRSDDADSYAAYLSTYPNGLHMADANEYIERDKQAKEAKLKLKEDQAWRKAQDSNDFQSYAAYVNAYPNGRYVPLAKLKQGKLRPARASYEPEMVAIPGKDYAMGKTEVTQAQWRAVMGGDPPELKFKGCDDCPVENVSWDDVQGYLSKLNQMSGKQYRLPTEQEWRHACDGGSSQEYCGSNSLDAVGWYGGNSSNKTHPVGLKQANGYGLHDMTGNVWEWMQDCWGGDCRRRVLRGGSWEFLSEIARAANRFSYSAEQRLSSSGFRVVVRSARTD